VINETHRCAGDTIIADDTPLGRYIFDLERQLAEATEAADDYRRRWSIAVDERNRGEKLISELAGLLDAALDGIPVRRRATAALTLARPPRLLLRNLSSSRRPRSVRLDAEQ